MMKVGYAVNTLVATLLVVPAITLQSRESEGLERALADTVRALEYLTGLQAAPADPSMPLAEIARRVTEPPYSDARERDDVVVRLRADVSRLQMVYDDLAKLPPTIGDPALVPPITTGLADAARLAGDASPVASSAPITSTGAGTGAHAGSASKPSTMVPREELGFSADPLRQGQALYRAARYEECIRWLAPRRADPNAEYWIARSLEKLERIDDAVESYKKVAENKAAGSLGVRAKNDYEFLEWRRAFGSKLEKAPASGAEKP